MSLIQTHRDPVAPVATPRPRESEPLHLLDGIARDLTPAVWELGAQCSVLRLPPDLTARERGLLDAVELNVRRIARVLASVHDLLLAETGEELPLDPRRSHLSELCGEAVELLREVGIDREIGVEGEGTAEGEWDPERLSAAISLLLECAHDAALDDRGAVQLRWRGGPEDVVLTIERAASPGERSGIDLELGAKFGLGPERGVKAAVARRVILGHGGTLARFATARAVAYVALLPRRAPDDVH